MTDGPKPSSTNAQPQRQFRDQDHVPEHRNGRAVFSAASAALIVRPEDAHVLLVHHKRSNTWVLAGGKAEWDEPPMTTCRRESEEELGVPVVVRRLLVVNWMTEAAELFPGAADSPFAYPCFMTTWHVTLADPATPIRVPSDELLGYRWRNAEEAAASGDMEPYNASNLLTAWQVLYSDSSTAYLES